jgi:A/G-specific adenine glycosylase
MDPMDAGTARSIRKNLLRWFRASRRDLPWRRHYRPYEVWISEVMLQQTQVKTVLPYYERWMARFPDIRSVAEAPEDTLLKHWEGLGYYSRARNIQKTAQILLRDYDGEVPAELSTLRKLPGIGPYTAAAILSLAFNQDHPVVDGNVKRVFARLHDMDKPVGDRESLRFIEESADRLLPRGEARDFNQALMELGAVVCTPRNPLCDDCPLAEECRSRLRGVVNERPVSAPRKTAVFTEVAVGLLVSRGRIFIQKRPPGGLMPLLWEFPGGKVKDGETPERALVREFMEELEIRITGLRKFGVIRHSYTSFRVTLHAFLCRLEDGRQRPVLRSAVDGRWVTPRELADYPFPAANQRLIRALPELDRHY